MTSALFALSSDAGATYAPAGAALAGARALSYNASGSYALRARLDSTAGVGVVSWTVTSADDVTLSAGPLPVAAVQTDLSCVLSIPKSAATYLLTCVVNSGIDPATGGWSEELVKTLAIKVKTQGGIELVAAGERLEGDPLSGWLPTLNALALGGGAGGSGVKRFVVPIFYGLAKSAADSSAPDLVAAFQWDPALYIPAGASGVTVAFKAVMRSTSLGSPAQVDLALGSGFGATPVAGSTLGTGLVTDADQSVDLTSELVDAAAGVYSLRLWFLPGEGATGTDRAVVSGARLEVAWA